VPVEMVDPFIQMKILETLLFFQQLQVQVVVLVV
jgi:hypothetical protein